MTILVFSFSVLFLTRPLDRILKFKQKTRRLISLITLESAEKPLSIYHFDWYMRIPYESIFDMTIMLSVSELGDSLLVSFDVAI